LFTSWRDIDGDNDLDLVIGDIGVTSNESMPDGGSKSALYINNGDGTFFEGTVTRLSLMSDNYRNGAE
jgi:hypothetical protein